MHIPLPNGDKLIPDGEFAEKVGATRRTLSNYDDLGLPFAIIAGVKYRPLNEGLSWVASCIRRRNPPRRPGAA
jgi:hypothetical protein